MKRLKSLIVLNRYLVLAVLLTVEFAFLTYQRLPITKAPIFTHFEYQLGQVVISSENWQREGIITRSVVPSRSIDQEVPEWSASDQDYFSMPPLAFLLHYGAERVFGSSVHPIVLGKVIGHVVILLAVLVSAFMMLPVFGFWITHLVLLFFMTSKPVLIWNIDGYFPPTLSLVVFLVLTAWCLNRLYVISMALKEKSGATNYLAGKGSFVITAVIGFLAGFSEYLSVIGVGIASIVLLSVVLGTYFREKILIAKYLLKHIISLIAGCVLAVLAMFALYSNLRGYSYFLEIFLLRGKDRTSVPLADTFLVVTARQFLAGWSMPILYATVSASAIAAVLFFLAIILNRRVPTNDKSGPVMAAIWLAFVPSFIYHFVFRNLVYIHYWFSATWAVYLSLVFGFFLLSLTVICSQKPFELAKWKIGLIIILATYGLTNENMKLFAEYKYGYLNESKTMPSAIYSELDSVLPRDRAPIIFISPEENKIPISFPFASANLLRPILLYSPEEGLTLMSHKKEFSMSKVTQFGYVYIAYNPSQLSCPGNNLSVTEKLRSKMIGVCQVPTERLADTLNLSLDSIASVK